MTTVRVLLGGALSFLLAACSSPPQIPRWQNTGGPAAQDVSTLLVEGADGGVLTAGLTTGEVFRSTDEGRSWRRTGALPLRAVLHALRREPGGSRLYAATGSGLFLSSDDGASWTAAPGAAPAGDIRSIAIDPLDPAAILIGITDRGVYRTSDGGAAWTRVVDGGGMPTGPVHVLDTSPLNPNTILTSLDRQGIFLSNDRGVTWSPLTSQLAHSGTVARCAALHPRTPGLLCFGTAAGDVYRTGNGGERWTVTRQGINRVPLTSLVPLPGEPGTLLTSSEAGLHRSTDWGATWQSLPSDLPAVPATLVSGGTPRRPLLFAFAPGIGLQRSENGGGSWQAADRGLGGSTPGLITAGTRSGELYCTAGPALFIWRRGASSWVSASAGIYGGALTSLAFDVDGDSILYAANETGIFRTTTAGRVWEPMPRTYTPSRLLFFDTHRFIRTRMFLAKDDGMLVSTDRGSSWKPVRPFGERARVRRLTYTPANAGIIHAVTEGRGVLGTTDGGITWESRRYGIRDTTLTALARDRDNPRTMYCWNDRGDGYRSTDMGAEWTSWAPPWPAGARVRITVDRDEPHRVVALAEGGTIYLSETGGAVWTSRTVAALDADVVTIFWNRREGMLYAGTVDNGVFRIPLPAPEANGR